MAYEDLAQNVATLSNRAYEMGARMIIPNPHFPAGAERAKELLRQLCFVDLPPVFEPYTQLPDPTQFDGMIFYLTESLKQLSVGQDTRDPISAHGDVYFANVRLTEMAACGPFISDWTGDAAMEFKKGFIDPFPALVHNQFILVSALKATLDAERALWDRARHDIDSLVTQAIMAIDAVDDCTAKEWAVTFTALAALTGVVLAIPTGGASLLLTAEAIANAQLTISVIGAAAWVAAALPPTDGPKLIISGHDVRSVIDSIVSNVNQMTTGLNQQEESIATSVRKMADAFRNNPGCFIAPRPLLAGITDPTKISSAMGEPH